MSAKRTHTILSVALTQIALACAAQGLRAATPDGSSTATPARAALQKPVTPQDADLMLREARGDIEQGRLEEADALVSRVESAHINFSMFHVGPNPASVRRELTRAQRMSHPAGKAPNQADTSNSKSHLPFARNGSSAGKTTEDPFIAHHQANDQKSASSTPPGSASLAQSSAGRGLGSVSTPEPLPSQKPAAVGRSVDNPFASAGRNAQLGDSQTPADRSHALNGLSYPVTPASGAENPYRVAGPAGSSNSVSALAESSSQNPSWSLPDAPHPAGIGNQSSVPPSSSSLTPQRPAASQLNAAPSRESQPKQQAQAKLSAARKALQAGDIAMAEKLTRAADALGVPESQYLPDEDRPSLVAADIARAKQKGQRSQPSIERLPAITASRYETQPAQPANLALSSPSAQMADATPAAYRVEDNKARKSPTARPTSPGTNRVTSMPSADSPAAQPTGEGPKFLTAPPLSAMENTTASPLRIAAATPPPSEELPGPATASPATTPAEPPMVEAPLPPPTTAPAAATAASAKPKASLIDSADENQKLLAQKLSAEIGKRQSEAQRLEQRDPERAVATLKEAQQLVNDSKLPESTRRELLSRIEITLLKSQKYINDHRSEIDLDKKNESVRAEVDRDRDMKLKLQQKVAEMVNEFNQLQHEHRYAEMEIVARRLNELAPDDPVAQQVWLNAKFIRREVINRQLVDDKERTVWETLNAVEQSAKNPVAKDGEELVFDKKHWADFVQDRKGSKDRNQHHTPRELEIERRLQTPVLLKYQETPLSEVMGGLSELTGVNIHLDPRGLTQEGINSDTPVTISLTKEITLKSALNLILEPLHLSYVINDEVLKITSEQLRDGQIYAQTYNVADLVTPIPNFVPNNNIGLQGLINEATASAGHGKIGLGQSPTVLVNGRGQKDAAANGDVLAQQFNAAPASGTSPSAVPIGAGPGGMGAGANADFDSLIDLIVSTISTDTWAENGGGQAEIRPFPTNLSLVISQTQAVHEEIADLLQQLRRLQDLQVTIEVRFITINDNFFERIGVDFQMNINDSKVSVGNVNQFQPNNPEGKSNTVGLLSPAGINTFPNFTTDLDVPFRQNSFALTQVVPFSGPVGGGANFGFAILSDIEAFFLIEAAQGDRRSNILNAPKVTLFNGQQAFVADASQRPFVVGVIPVVGEFASAQQPVIVVLNEGTMMTIQAVVSDDRRYVRMTIVPFFTQIGKVDTFTFEGSSSTTSSSSATDNNNDGKNDKKDTSDAATHSGVTVQLPEFKFVSVVTTVSVPDGGTVLLGGIKRLNEGRTEFGVPLLSKVPYINRLFKNVAIGRETNSLMMMVTPRIIIQEEEEERLGVASPTP